MVDFARVQNRIYYGYGKAAIRLGTQHAIYRTLNPINPIQAANLVGNTFISIDQNLKYMTPKKYGDLVWQFLPFDGLSLQDFDYMVGGTTTYFIADIAPDDRLSPPLCVECNAVISVNRPTNAPLPAGTVPYQQYQPATSVLKVQAMPCMLLQHSKIDAHNLKLPTSVKLPYFAITIPEIDGLDVITGDIITDDNGRRLAVISSELTRRTLGLRIVAVELGV